MDFSVVLMPVQPDYPIVANHMSYGVKIRHYIWRVDPVEGKYFSVD